MDITRPPSLQPLPSNAKLVFTGVLFSVYQWEQTMFDGRVATFEKLVRPDTVTIFPVTPEGKILITREEQPGRPPFVSVPGGRIETSESVLAAAARELLEETGYQASHFTLLSAHHPTVKIDWVVYTLIAHNVTPASLPQLDSGEKITLSEVSLTDFINSTLQHDFVGADILKLFYEAKLDQAKMTELTTLFQP